jgi:hypothetical protein
MKTSVLLRLVLLTIFLVIIIWGSVQIRKGGMVGLFASLGADIGNPNYVNICPKRIRSFTWLDDTKQIAEVKTSGIDTEWLAYDPSPRPLNYLSLEKWLSEHCLTQGEALQDGSLASLEFKKIVEIEYTNGKKLSLESTPSLADVFRWEGRIVRAPNLRSGLEDLRSLAGWAPLAAAPSPSLMAGQSSSPSPVPESPAPTPVKTP